MFKKTFVVVFLLILLFGALFLINPRTKDKTDLNAEVPKVKNNPNLAKFYLWTKEDPLFTSPDFNEKEFSKSLMALELEEKAYLKQVKKKNNFCPIKFLKDLPLVKKAEETFFSNPTLISSKNLLDTYKRTQKDYKDEQSKLVIILKSGGIVSTAYAGINTTTSLTILYDDFKKIDANADELSKEINRRELCLIKGECFRPAFSFEKPFPQLFSPPEFSKGQILPRDLLTLSSIENSVFFGPYVVSTPCFGGGDNPYYLFYVLRGKERRNFVEYPERLNVQTEKIATTNYYRKILNSPSEKTIDGSIISRGFKMVQVYETHIYVCADSSYKNKIASLDSLYQNNKDNLLFGKILKEKDLEKEAKGKFVEADAFERKFFKAEFTSEIDAQTLAKEYGYMYKNIVLWKNDPKFKNRQWLKTAWDLREEMLSRYLNYDRKLSNVHEIFADAAGHLAALRIKSLINGIDSSSYAYAYRNMYDLVYFPFSPSFYRIKDSLKLIDVSGKNNAEGVYFTYQDALTNFKPEEIKKWNIALTDFLEEDYARYNKNLKNTPAAKK